MQVVTTRDTVWNEPGKGRMIIPAGTEGFVMSSSDFHELEDGHEKSALYRARKMYDKREIDGVFVYLMGRHRFMKTADLARR